MGLSYRGNTRKNGKSEWFNYSASSRGLHGSYTQKLSKNITVNVNKYGSRATVNLGNGIRWTSYRKHKSDITIGQLIKCILYIFGFVFALFLILAIITIISS
jgi:hypothetical protein